MDRDPLGLGGGAAQPLTEMEVEALTPFAATLRDQVVTILTTSFSKEVEILNVEHSTILGSELEASLVGDYFLVRVDLQQDAFQVLTFLERNEATLAFDLDPQIDVAEQTAKLEEPVSLICEAIGDHLALEAGGAFTIGTQAVVAVSLSEDFPSLLIEADGTLVSLAYQLQVGEVGPMQVSTVVPLELVRRLAAAENEGMMERTSEPAVPAGLGVGDANDPLAGLGGDAFQIPTGRTGADILESIPPLTDEASLGGFAMPSGAGYGAPAAHRSGAPESVRPAQFPSFGEAGSREPVSNIDLIMDVNLKITVELGRTSKSIREVLDLGPGAVIELDKLAGEPVDILVNDKPIAKGEVVVVDENFGVRVTDIISPAGRVATLR